MDSIISVLQSAWRYIMLVRITDVLDVAIMSFAIYKLLSLVRSTRAENIFKGIVIFIVALWLSSLLNLRGINYILSYVVEWGVLALFIVSSRSCGVAWSSWAVRISVWYGCCPRSSTQQSWKKPLTRPCWPAWRCQRPGRAF